MRAPRRRSDDLVVEAVEDELLVYDRANQRAHCLSATAARVWRACDGDADLAAMSEALGLPLHEVREAVEELEAAALLDQGLELVKVGADGADGNSITRRDFALRSAKVGTAAATAPLILSVAAPAAAQTMTPPTPTPQQCELYSATNCGNGGCSYIAGCCCCNANSSGPGVPPGTCSGSCNACSSIDFCNSGRQMCGTNFPNNFAGSCTGGTGTTLINPYGQGCCRVAQGTGNLSAGILAGCGCAFSTVPGSNPNYVACCHADPNGGLYETKCASGNAPYEPNWDCFPCCLQSDNTTFKSWIGVGSEFGCCGQPTVPNDSTCVNYIPVLPPPPPSAATSPSTATNSPGAATNSPGATTTNSPGATSTNSPAPTTTCVVPNLRGDTLTGAWEALNQHQCSLGQVRHRRTRKRNRGRVIAQSVRPGRTLLAGHAIGVTIGR